MRLARAVEESEKLKSAFAREKERARDAADEARKEKERLDGAVRRLERQKVELLAAFRKQLKLIDILKRQKIHMEAARLLAFTEDDFMRVVSWEDGDTAAVGNGSRANAPANARS